MIRIVIVETDACAAANVGGPPVIRYRTFDVEAPAVEAFINDPNLARSNGLVERSIVGVELLPPETKP